MNDTAFSWKTTQPVKLTEDHLISVLMVRRARHEVLGQNLFSDPAWDILLELFGAKLGRRTMTAAELASAIEIPQSTTFRWISALQKRGLLKSDKVGSNNTAELSAKGSQQMERLASRWAGAFQAIT